MSRPSASSNRLRASLPLQLAVRGRGLTLAQALDIYQAATPTERQQIQRQVRLKVMTARGKPWEWNQRTTAQVRQFFGIAPPPPAALLRLPYATAPQAAAPIPQFAKGAVVKSPTVALIAEKEPETVFPVRKLVATQAGRRIYRLLRAKGLEDVA